MRPIKYLLATLFPALFAVLGVAVPAPATSVSAATASEDATSWTVETGTGRYGPGRAQFGYTMKPGAKLSDALDIVNTGTGPVRLAIYAADGFTAGSGDLDVRGRNAEPRDVGAWLRPVASAVTIPPGRQAHVPFEVAVPAGARPGDHVGGIVTELARNGAEGAQRSWLPVKVRVTGGFAPQLRVEDVGVDFAGTNPLGTGSATLSYTVRNTGDTVLSGLPRATFSGALGLASRTVAGQRLPELLPGEQWDARVRVDPLTARLWVSGRLTVTPVLRDAAGSTSTLDPVTASARSYVSTWSFVVMIVPLLLVTVVLWLLLRLLKQRREASRARQ